MVIPTENLEKAEKALKKISHTVAEKTERALDFFLDYPLEIREKKVKNLTIAQKVICYLEHKGYTATECDNGSVQIIDDLYGEIEIGIDQIFPALDGVLEIGSELTVFDMSGEYFQLRYLEDGLSIIPGTVTFPEHEGHKFHTKI